MAESGLGLTRDQSRTKAQSKMQNWLLEVTGGYWNRSTYYIASTCWLDRAE